MRKVYQLHAKGLEGNSFVGNPRIIVIASKNIYTSQELASLGMDAFRDKVTTPKGPDDFGYLDADHLTISVVELDLVEE